MSKIGDLWVRLGLKKEEFDQGMRDAKTTTEGFGGTLSKLKTAAVAVWAAIGVAVAKVATEFVQHSQVMGDAWNRTMAGMKTVWSSFLTSLTNWDWNNFTNKIKTAFDDARNAAAVRDSSFEVTNSINIRKGQMQDELAQLQILARDTRKSYKERAAAAKDYLEKVKPLYDAEIAQREKLRVSELDLYLGQAGVSKSADNRQALETFLTDVAPNGQLVEALRQYNFKNQGKKYKLTADDERMIDELFKGMSYSTSSAMALFATQYQGTNDEEAKRVVDAITNLYAAKAAFNEETRRMQTTMATNEAQMSKGTASATADNSLFIPQLPQIMLNTEKELEKDKKQLQRDLEEFFDMNAIEVDFEMPEGVKQFLEEAEAVAEHARALGQEFEDAIVTGFSAGCQELTDQLFGLTDINAGAVLQALLSPLADIAIREGEILMAQGAGIEAVKTGLETLNGGIAIAAGAALIAIGAAAKSGLAALANRGSATGATTTSAAAASTGGGSGYIGTVEDMELTVKIEGRLSGSDIVLAAQRTQTNWAR